MAPIITAQTKNIEGTKYEIELPDIKSIPRIEDMTHAMVTEPDGTEEYIVVWADLSDEIEEYGKQHWQHCWFGKAICLIYKGVLYIASVEDRWWPASNVVITVVDGKIENVNTGDIKDQHRLLDSIWLFFKCLLH